MTRFAVIREHGPGWDHARGMREQELWDEHAAFMDELAEEGFIVVGGPLGDGRTLLIFEAADEAQIEARLTEDPWVPTDMLRIAWIRPWEILLGSLPA